MAKHPVPKKKVSQSRTAKRYAAFVAKKRRKINGFVNVVACSTCGSPTLNQHACPQCGSYRGRKTIDVNKAADKITKIKA